MLSARAVGGFSALQRAENSSIYTPILPRFRASSVSVLFSEPKIPQCVATTIHSLEKIGFSALQRAENSSIPANPLSSAGPESSFSALQRAENSSINPTHFPLALARPFQCSSASRKFLNLTRQFVSLKTPAVSVLFSEPKIPQSPFPAPPAARSTSVSVLFSEPKIPQLTSRRAVCELASRFQCSSASRKFLNPVSPSPGRTKNRSFSALQRAENSSIHACRRASRSRRNVSVLFSEPKIPQCCARAARGRLCDGFSALQRAENSSINSERHKQSLSHQVSVLFSEPKIPQCAAEIRSARNM